MNFLVNLYLELIGVLLLGVLFLHLIPRLGKASEPISDFFIQAPGLDFALAYFTLMPLIVGKIIADWTGLALGLAAELTALFIWVIAHEIVNYQRWDEPKIHRTLSRIFGAWRNHLAVWITALAVPTFWVVRFTEIIVYPPLTWLIKLPKYNSQEWVNVSRHKFDGLIGYDLIWCLYCDWMTGVWSLGTEMLRNVESFWCPIRFYSDKKCENCKIDFPDLENGWIAPNENMEKVSQLLEEKYDNISESTWFGHPSRKEENFNNIEKLKLY